VSLCTAGKPLKRQLLPYTAAKTTTKTTTTATTIKTTRRKRRTRIKKMVE
jgi:hypothetical protein